MAGRVHHASVDPWNHSFTWHLLLEFSDTNHRLLRHQVQLYIVVKVVEFRVIEDLLSDRLLVP